jgi:hypothetical protein
MCVGQEHEYALLDGVNRAKVGRYLAILSGLISGAIVYVLLAIVDVAKRVGLPVNVPPTLFSLVSAGAVFAVLYWALDRYAWRWSRLAQLLRVPDLSGQWDCEGESLNQDGTVAYQWKGLVTIVQSWDKIRVRLKTQQSGSNSISAALICDKADGYVLIYHYRNDPKVGQPELNSHRGFAELTFSNDRQSAAGDYFNGAGRSTFGRMKLSKRAT